jgi:hypothetical protein
MTSHRSRTWAPRGPTPTVRFNGGSRGHFTLAALACNKPGERSRLIYRPRVQGHLRGDHRGFTWQDYRDLIVRPHRQLAGPIIVIWDNLNVRRSAASRQWAAGQDWLTIIQLPTYSRPQPGRRHLVTAATLNDRKCRLRRPRPPGQSRPFRPAPHPAQTLAHRRLPGRHRSATTHRLIPTTLRKAQ